MPKYTKVRADWKDLPDTSTPVMAADIEQMEEGIAQAVTTEETLTAPPSAPLWKRVFSYTLATTQQNISEVYIGSVLRSWRNEWRPMVSTASR